MLDIIANSFAGGKLGKRDTKRLITIVKTLRAHKIKYQFHFTEYAGHAKVLTEELIKNGATDIIVAGGDGTLHEVLNGFSNFDKVNLGVIPMGTGNDFAHAIGIPMNIKDAVEIIANNPPQYTDFIQFPGVRGMNIAGFGVDVDVLKRYAKVKHKSTFAYTWCLVKTLLNFKYTDFQVEINGEKKDYHAFMACLANGIQYGGGIKICPIANPTDNKLDFLTITAVSFLGVLKAFIKLKAGKVLTLKTAIHQNVQNIKITPKEPCTIEIDGELYDNIPFDATIVSNTLKMYRNI